MLSLAHLDRYYQIYMSQGVGMDGVGLIYSPLWPSRVTTGRPERW